MRKFVFFNSHFCGEISSNTNWSFEKPQISGNLWIHTDVLKLAPVLEYT